MSAEKIFDAVLQAFNIILFVYSAYNVLIAVFSLRRYRPAAVSATYGRFVFLIAARNEENVIGNLVESLKRQDYPKELYDIVVVPNNCTDRTQEFAARAGARILHCDRPVRSKGDVLNFALHELAKTSSGFDAICVIDADNLVHPGFLTAMNNALAAGSQVAQGFRDSKNPLDTGIAGSYSIYFWLVNRFYCRSRHLAGLSVPIGGSGFMISTSLIRQMPDLEFMTMTEDLELTILCSLADAKVTWVRDAIVYDEQPLTFLQSWKQRRRWSAGMFQLSRRYARPIQLKCLRDRKLRIMDLTTLFRAVHMHVLWFISLVLNSVLSLYRMFEHRVTLTDVGIGLLTSLAGSFLLLTLTAAAITVIEKKMQPGMWRGILTFWFFLMSWLPINLVCSVRKPKAWEQIRHERSIRIQDIS